LSEQRLAAAVQKVAEGIASIFRSHRAYAGRLESACGPRARICDMPGSGR
jgi:hypothetical protein